MTNGTSSSALTAVDWPSASHADEVAHVLTSSGLHPHYDRPRVNSIWGGSFTKSTIYVPEAEATRAREVLSGWYAGRNARVARMSSGIYRGLLLPAGASIGLGVIVGLVFWDIGFGLVVAFLSFIPMVGFVHKRRSR